MVWAWLFCESNAMRTQTLFILQPSNTLKISAVINDAFSKTRYAYTAVCLNVPALSTTLDKK